MRVRILITLTLVMLACSGIGIALGFKGQTQLIPAGQGLPDGEIVFIPEGTYDTLGFIYPDGSGYETRNIRLSGGLWDDLKKMSRPGITNWITWSPDGDFLATSFSRYQRSTGIPMLLSTSGEFLLCPDDESSPYSSGRSWIVSDTTLITVDNRSNQETDRVLLLDMETCTVISTLYLSQPDEGISEATLSSQGWLAIARGVKDRGLEILITDPERAKEIVLPGGQWPAWSRDGEWLAYTIYEDGLYVVRKDGSEKRKLVDNPRVGEASWSPDGAWLIYGRRTIYKINVETGEEYELYQGGNHPNWRWASP